MTAKSESLKIEPQDEAQAKSLFDTGGEMVELHWPNGECETVFAGQPFVFKNRQVTRVERIEMQDIDAPDYSILVPSHWLKTVKNY